MLTVSNPSSRQGYGDDYHSKAQPLFYDVSCTVNFRKSGSLFVDVTYTHYNEGSPKPWRAFQETLHVEH